MVAVALPAIGDDLGADPGTLTLWLVTSYLFVNVVLQSPAGKLGDIFGRRRAVIVYRSGLTKGTGVLSGARRIDVTMSITRIPL